MALFSAAIRRDSIFLPKFAFFGHVPVFMSEILTVFRLKYSYRFLLSHFCFRVSVMFVFMLVSDVTGVLPLSILRMVLSNLLAGGGMCCSGIYSFDEISAVEFLFKKFSRSSKVLFSYFFFSLISAYWMVSASNIPKLL